MIPFLSLSAQTAALRDAALAALAGVVDTQGFSNGPAVAVFEAALAAFVGCKDAVCVNSGTSALHAALIAAGVGPGDEVVTVPHTWISTVWAISYVGARPVFVDVDRATCGMNPARLREALTPNTKAIIPVHLYGHPVDLDPILEQADRARVPVIEDCAQSVGALYKGRQTGTFGRVNATSFYPGKNLGAFGEGGAVLTDDTGIAARVRSLRDHAQQGRHNHVEVGFNWRMDGFQGAILSLKLQHLNGWNTRRKAIAARYLDAFVDLPGISVLPAHPWADPIWHIFPVFHVKRDEFRARLEALGVQTGVHYPRPVHRQPVYTWLGYDEGSFPVAEELAAQEISLPMFPELTDQDVGVVVEAVRRTCREI